MTKKTAAPAAAKAKVQKSEPKPVKETPVVVSASFDNSKITRFRSKLHKPHPSPRLKKALMVVAVLVIIAGLVNVFLTRSIRIGSTTITPQEVGKYASQLAHYSAKPQSSFGGTPRQIATNDLVLNAALKDQAAKHHVIVKQSDIDATLASQYQYYGSRDKYLARQQSLGFDYVAAVRAENKTYAAKLIDSIIAKKTVFLAAINYDTPYVNGSNNPDALRAQAVKKMQDTFLPLFQQKKGDAEIAAQTDINILAPTSGGNPRAYFDGMPSTAYVVTNCTPASDCFNDIDVKAFANIPGLVSTQSEIDKLHSVGQYSGVFTSKAGFVGIIRLESKTPGGYDSWQQFLSSYETKYTGSRVYTGSSSSPQALAYLGSNL